MPNYIIKLTKDPKVWYLEWSTVVDAPVTFGMSLKEFKSYYREQYGAASMRELDMRLERVERLGTSSLLGHTVQELISTNPKKLTLDEIIEWYCVKRKNPPKG